MRHCFLRAALHTILAVLPEMRRRGEGRIANIASIGGQVSVPHLVPYSASKFALVGLSEGLRAELCHVGRTGKASTSALSPSVLTVLGDRAARRNNQQGKISH
jgi:short-subunit dehydrogenase